MYVLYSAALAVALVLAAPFWAYRAMRHGKYRAGFGERWGRIPARLGLPLAGGSIWVHAVSVGEVLAVSGLVQELRARFPERRVLISTITTTGQKLAAERFGPENVFYFPLDFAFAVRAWLRALRPEMVVLAETEFWPNFLRLAKAGGARIAVVNGRISDRSWPRYRRFRGLMQPVLDNVDLFLAQSEEDRRRLVEIGAAAERVQVSGNLKFDAKPPGSVPLADELRAAMARSGAGPVLVCGSTVEGEESMLLRAFKAVLERYPRTMMLLAPRHPERFEQVAGLLAASGVRFQRRSQWSAASEVAGSVFLLDSIGELASTYALAQVAFIGGSLVARGGHNVLEPAYYGAAILVGPHTENFRDTISLFRKANALRVVTPDELAPAFLQLLEDDRQRQGMGRRATDLLRAQSGATARTLAALDAFLNRQPAAEALRAGDAVSPRLGA